MRTRCSAPRAAGLRIVALLAVSLLVVAGCGNRLDRDEILAQNVVTGGGQSGTSNGGGSFDGGDGGEFEGTDTVDGGGVDTGGDAGTTDGTGGDGGPDADAGSTPGATPAGSGGRGGGDDGDGNAATGGPKKPLTIGMVGWLSGIGGQTSATIRDVLVAWSKSVNAKGGINGHPVQLLVADDGGNESRSLSLVRDFVENKGAVAIVAYSGGSAVAVSKYARENKVPIIGGNIIEQLWTENPMMFPTNAATEGHFFGGAKLAKAAGAKRIATVFCTEVTACQQSNDVFVKHARALGMEVVYEGRISFTQPDYTAECLQMRNSNADMVVPITENSSTVRMAESCARQNFEPVYNLPAVNSAMAKNPVFDGALGNVAYFPWFLHSGSPALDEYGAALRKYAPGRIENGVDAQAGGWMAGKLFEAAAQNVSDNPTKEEILEGLWAMRGETLGGLLNGPMARTFSKDQPTPETFCVYDTRIQNGKWVAPNGLEPTCR